MSHSPPPRLQVREVASDLQQAEAMKLVRVVAVLDAMGHRGVADDMLVPLRPRLARLRPPRPLRFSRLLFHPLNAVIVPAPAWRRGSPSVPRSAITPITDVVRARMGAACGPIDALIEGHLVGDTKILAAAGAQLWPAAARVLADAVAPADWTDVTGLQPADFTALAKQIAAALGCAAHAGFGLGADKTLDLAEAGRAIGEVAKGQPRALTTVMALVMTEMADLRDLMKSVEPHVAPPEMATVRVAIDEAYDFMVNTATGAPPLAADLAVAEQDLRRVVALLETHERRPTQTAERNARINDLVRRTSQEARARFDTALSEQVLLPMRGNGPLSDQDVATVEALARDLRRFEGTARRLGGREHFDKQLRAGSEALRPRPGESREQRADKLRMVEILAGADVAMGMLKESK